MVQGFAVRNRLYGSTLPITLTGAFEHQLEQLRRCQRMPSSSQLKLHYEKPTASATTISLLLSESTPTKPKLFTNREQIQHTTRKVIVKCLLSARKRNALLPWSPQSPQMASSFHSKRYIMEQHLLLVQVENRLFGRKHRN